MSNLARKIIEFEEGWRDEPYYCSEGYPTVGYGFKIAGKGDPLPSFSLPKVAGSAWLGYLIDNLEQEMTFQLDGINNAGRRAVLLSMAYQMGINGVMQFRNMWSAIERKDWGDAADQMLESRWARQTPERASRHARIMRGENPNEIYP